MRVQAFSPELAIEAFDEAVVSRFTWTREVKNNAFVVSPQIKIPRDKLRSLINTDCFWIANIFADAFQCLDNIFAPIAEPRVHNWREPTEGIYNRQDADLGSGGELIMDKVHGPRLIDLSSVFPIISKLGLHPALRTVGGQMIHGIICFSASMLRNCKPISL